MRRQQQRARSGMPLDERGAGLARQIGIGVRLRRHRGEAELNLVMDDIAGHDAAPGECPKHGSRIMPLSNS